MINVFGGGELDFTEARFSAQTTRITIYCIFGGASLLVRDGMHTISKALCIFGGVSNRASSTTDRNAPTLVIQGIALFGGTDVRVKKTAKQRLQEFANTLRTMFDPVEPPRA
jgi:hypothetical protein